MIARPLATLAAIALSLLAQAHPGRAAHGGDWHPRAAELCLEPGAATASTPEQARIKALLARIGALQEAPDPLLRNISARGTAICIDDRRGEARGYFDVEANYIGLSAALPPGEMLVILIHELRHLDQLVSGYCPSTDFSMNEAARFTFAMEADAQAIVTLYAWWMREAADPGPWQVLQRFPKYADIAQRFADAIAGGADPGTATGAAFEQWYASDWRRESYYLASCADYLDRLDSSKALPSYQLLPEGYFDALCRLPGGGAYPCDPQGGERGAE